MFQDRAAMLSCVMFPLIRVID